ncbi:VOC family protein [Frankia sp. CNm7]|uniref:VOC family protein n=1 Tax=Frankia nepalensis TaxID=1836974 RepID=A0A937RPL5_9ACTN|nr:VOC family protein [Frankia nepalensis]MBL7495831.1 VOC family protein [Frankia nepalensis]MBL7509907.1 VOC family protein [Frankia nepalensis]MBL7521079.1 VOC family protein [Frankia nepalensis]MBL7629666.1 VOC family protein [Frankia nepalensis]
MSTTSAGIIGLDRIAQVKLPVSDLAGSVAWYCRLLDLRLWVEIVEDGVPRGAGLIDPQGRFNIALRDRAACASQPDLNGFDVVAFLPGSRSVLHDMVARCARLGIGHGGIQDTPAGALLDIPDPDGTVLRFYHFTDPTDGFTGVEFRDGKHVGNYDIPRLRR